MAQFIRLCTQGRCGEIMVNVDEISSCHIEDGFGCWDYILILKNGTRYHLNSESYNKVMNLISEYVMTDREKLEKVRAEIERQYNYHKDHADDWAGTEHFWKADEDRKLLSFIDSMQEKSTTSVWHDANDIPVASKTKVVLYTNGKWDLFKAYEAKDDFDNYWAGVNQSLAEKGVFVKQWSYVDDLLNISKKEEPVSEDLEEVAQEYTEKGSKCQEELDAFKAGAQWKEQQLVAKAVKVKISNAGIVSLPVNCDLRVGDKVLIIKEY